MRATAYLRVARQRGGKALITATARPSASPLRDPRGRDLPTVAFAVELDIPNVLLDRASQVVAKLTIPEDAAEIVASIEEVAR